jgi:hypothetical protein
LLRERKSASVLQIYLNKNIWDDFQKFIVPSGISVLKMLKAILRMACNPKAGIEERIYYAMLKTVSKVEKKES